MITVGIDMIPRSVGVDGFSSISIFTTLTLSPSSPLICSTMGAIMRHGPHHVAQKSTRTGMLDFRTELSNSPSVTDWMSDILRSLLRTGIRFAFTLAFRFGVRLRFGLGL